MPPRKPELAAPERAIDGAAQGDDVRYDRALRPKTLDDYIGQTKHKENLRVFVEAARRRGEPLDHLLLCGPPGLGKTTLAQILAHEMGVELHATSGPVVEHKGALAGLLTKLGRTTCSSSTRSTASTPSSRRASTRRWRTSASTS